MNGVYFGLWLDCLQRPSLFLLKAGAPEQMRSEQAPIVYTQYTSMQPGAQALFILYVNYGIHRLQLGYSRLLAVFLLGRDI